MQNKQLRKFRTFIFLLLTVFFTDTVYASGMMVANQLCDNHSISAKDHGAHHMHQHEKNHHDDGQKKSTDDNCSKCGHCMACFTVLPPSQIIKMQLQVQAIEISLFEPSYLSHISLQPQRPPIS